MAVHEISKVSELKAALLSSRGGDTIVLAPGVYDGVVLIDTLDFDPPLTIRSAEPEDPAIFSGRMLIKNSSGVTLEDLDFRLAPDEPSSWIAQVHLIGSENIHLQNVDIEGRIAQPGEGVTPESIGASFGAATLIEGYAFGHGVIVRESANVTFDEGVITKVALGVGIIDSDDVSMSNFHLHEIRRDGVVVVGSNDVSIADNLFESFRPFISSANLRASDHPDFIQYHNSTGERGIDSLTISRNAFLQGDGAPVQGIFGRLLPKTNGADQVAYTNFVITDNVINNGLPNALNLGDVGGAIVTGNILLPTPPDLSVRHTTVATAPINVTSDGPLTEDGLRDYAAGAVLPDTFIAGNLYVLRFASTELYVAGVAPDALLENGVIVEGNVSLSTDPKDPNWFGHVFPDLVDQPVTDIAALLESAPVGPSSLAPWIIEAASGLTGIGPREQIGGAGDDIVVAGPEGGKLIGGGGDDLLQGGAYLDTLYGQAGSDVMTGGARGDLFSLTMSAPGVVDQDVITDLNFGEGDVIMFSDGFPELFFRDDIDVDNVLETWGNGSGAIINEDADIEELLATTFVSLGDAAAGDVRLDFDFDRDGLVDYRLLLKNYDASFSDRNVEPLFKQHAPKEPIRNSFDFGNVLPLYSEMATVEAQGKFNLLFAEASGTLLLGSQWNDSILGGAGDDVLIGADGSDTMLLGGGADRVLLDITAAGDEDVIVDLNLDEGDALELFLPAALDLDVFRHISPGSVANSVIVHNVAGILELMDEGVLEIEPDATAVRLVFPAAPGGVYTLKLFDLGDGPIRAAIMDRDGDGTLPDQVLPLPDFAGGETLLIEGMPTGYFTGSGLPGPNGVSDGSAVELSSTSDIRAMLLARPDIGAIPLGDDKIELRFSDAGVRIASITLTDLGAGSSYKLAFGDPGAATRTGTDGNDRIQTFTGLDVLEGGAGDDYLRGAWDDDWLDGGAGNDTLLLDFGNDIAIGGAGADTFMVFGDITLSGDHDIVADFRLAEGDVLTFSRFAINTFEESFFRGRVHNVDSVEALVGLTTYGFELERRADDAVLVRFDAAAGVNTLEVHLDAQDLARFDELFTGETAPIL